MNPMILLLFATSVLATAPRCGMHLPKTATTPQPDRQARAAVVGGSNATAETWPWQIMLIMGCGGTIVSDSWILTAAHCFDAVNRTVVLAGISNINTTHEDGAKFFKSDSVDIKIHPGYTIGGRNGSDIALVKLSKAIVFDETMSPICLPNANQPDSNYLHAVVTGYGTYNIEDEVFERDFGQLRQAIVPMISHEICVHRLGKSNFANALPTVVFAGSMGHGTGGGDSGGPLMLRSTDGRWFQIGITSFGAGGKAVLYQDAVPGSYTDVRQYCNWIKETTGGEVNCEGEAVIMEDIKPQA